MNFENFGTASTWEVESAKFREVRVKRENVETLHNKDDHVRFVQQTFTLAKREEAGCVAKGSPDGTRRAP